jgi:hypothetical protein
MGTHDEETWAYFQGTDVQCVLVSRAKEEGVLAREFVGTCYTHHQVHKATKKQLKQIHKAGMAILIGFFLQKTVICDSELEDGSDRRRVVGKLGGSTKTIIKFQLQAIITNTLF